MRYFVLGVDGQRYGPADIDSLNQWIADGRLSPDMKVIDEASGTEFSASQVPGLTFAASAPNTFPPAPATVEYPRQIGVTDRGEKDLRDAWICAGLSLPCAGLIGLILAANAIKLAKRAKSKGNENSQGPIILSWITIGLTLLVIVIAVIAASTSR